MRLRIFPVTQAPSQARRLLADTLADEVDEEALESLRSVISELVAMSVAQGASSPIDLSVEITGDQLIGQVDDHGPATRALIRAKDRRDDSFALRIIEGLVDEWEVTPHGVRFRVPCRETS